MRIHRYILVVSLLTFLLLSGCNNKQSEQKEIIRPVRYQPVFVTGGERIRTFTGVAKSGIESYLSFRVPGTIKNISVKVGDNIRSGTIIASLDDTDYRLVVQEAEAALKQAEAQERAAASSYERIRGLYENRNASKNDLESARAQAESAKAVVQTTQKKLEQAQSQLSYTQLKAPADGSIATLEIELNENISAGQRITLLTSKGKTEIEVGLPEILINQVRENDIATVTFDAIPGNEFNAMVTEVGVAATGAVTTYPVIVTLTEISEQIRSGMAVQVTFTFRSKNKHEAIYVPPHAVAEDESGKYVFTAQPTGSGFATAKKTSVQIGVLIEEGLEINEGLSEGDLLITAGISKLTDGQTVRIGE